MLRAGCCTWLFTALYNLTKFFLISVLYIQSQFKGNKLVAKKFILEY